MDSLRIGHESKRIPERELTTTFWSVLVFAILAAAPCAAQSDSTAGAVRAVGDRHTQYAWTAAAGALVATAIDDRRLAAFPMSRRTRSLDRVARAADPFGRAGVLVPALAVSVVAPRLLGERTLADAMLRVASGYAAADAVESVLKPLVGRHRPAPGGSQWRFHPFRNDEQWHSFPSAHTVHSFSLATGLAMEAHTPWVAVPAYGIATLVGLQRVYTGAHWGSDVIGSAALAVVVAGVTDRELRRRGQGWLLPPVRRADDGRAPVTRRSLQLEVSPSSFGIEWAF